MQRNDLEQLNDLEPLLANDDHKGGKGSVDLVPAYSRIKMRHRVTLTQLKNLGLSSSTNSALAGSARLDFFYAGGEEAEKQFNVDNNRGYLFDGQKLSRLPLPDSEPAWSSPDSQNRSKLVRLFGKDDTDKIIRAHSQGPTYLLPFVLGSAYSEERRKNPNTTALIGQGDAQRINIFKRHNDIYQEIYADEFPIFDPIDGKNKIIGYLRGPVRAVFKLENHKSDDDKDHWGYALQYIESNNKDIINMLCGRVPSNKLLQQRNCQHRQFADAVQALERTIQDRDHQYDQQLKEQSIKVLHAAKEAFYSKKASEKDIVDVLRDTTNLIKAPTLRNADIYHRNAGIISKRPWGKMLGGAMLVLAGTALVAASAAVTLFSLGALAPVSILGFTLAASSLISGIAIGTGALGLATTASGSTLFAYGVKKYGVKKPKLRVEMESLAKQIKSR